MKQIITSVLILLAMTSYSAPTDNSKDVKKSNVEIAAASNAIAIQQLQQENAQLREQVESLTRHSEILESSNAYQLMMIKMFSRLNGENQVQQMEEMKAQLAYSQMMGNMFLTLRSVSVK
jgi:redox-regulated HSP33 family molecular chaperone